MRSALLLLLLSLLAAGCASAPPRPRGPRLAEIVAPAQTSIDVLLRSTVDLELSSRQVAELVKLQAELNGQVKQIKEEMAAARAGPPRPPDSAPGPEGAPPPPPPPPPPPISPYPPLVGPNRWVGAVRDSGDIGMMPRGPRERPEAVPPDYAERRAKLEALLEKYDQADAAAYARAEALFSEPQKAIARKLMEARAAERRRP